MNNLIENRQIRVFISSTFQDMKNERDYLMKYTFPELKRLAAERDVTLTELDLRWGITEEESQTGKVVEICLREIENSIPFFIGIIGNRYGWVPSNKDLSKNTKDRFPQVKDYIEHHLSVTEMEIQFGVLSREEDMHAYFYIKDGEEKENPDNPEMLEQLKKKVQASKYPSTTYSSLEDLGMQVHHAFIALLDRLFPVGHLSEFEIERIGQRSFMRQLYLNYIHDDRNFQVLDEWMNDWEQHHLVVTGASGLGKSALIANWLKKKLSDENRGYNIIYHFTGNGGSESSHEHITKSIENEIIDIYGLNEILPGPEVKLEDLFLKVSEEGNKPLLIVIDAINQIVDIENAKLLNWLPFPTKGIKILFSTLEEDRTMEVFKNRDYPIFRLQSLDIEQRLQMVKTYLKELYGKSLSEKQMERIVSAPQCENTLVLKTLLEELINYGIYEKLDERIEYYLGLETIDDFYQNLLQRFEEDYGRQFVKHTLSLIYVSKQGLQESLIQKLTDVPTFVWSQLYCSFIKNFVVKNGKLNFSHTYIRNAVFNRYIKENKEWEKDCRFDILSYTLEHPNKDTFFEEPFQLSMIQDKDTLKALYQKYMSIPEITATIYRYEKFNCIRYWKLLTSHGFDMHVLLEKDFSEMNYEKNQRMIFELTSLAYIFGDNELAHKLAEKQLEININTPNMPIALLIRSYNAAAQALTYTSNEEDFHKAIKYYFKAIEIADNAPINEIAVSFNGLGQCCLFGNKNDLALACGEKALEINKTFYGDDNHHEIAVNLNVIAQAHSNQGDYAEAIEAYTKAINILISIYGNYSQELFVAYYNLAHDQYMIKDYSAAIESISKAIVIIEKVYGKDYHDIDSYIKFKNHLLSIIESERR